MDKMEEYVEQETKDKGYLNRSKAIELSNVAMEYGYQKAIEKACDILADTLQDYRSHSVTDESIYRAIQR